MWGEIVAISVGAVSKWLHDVVRNADAGFVSLVVVALSGGSRVRSRGDEQLLYVMAPGTCVVRFVGFSSRM